jgi:hypothetical protein
MDVLADDAPGVLSYAYHHMTEGEPQTLGYYNVLQRIEDAMDKFDPSELVIPALTDLNQDHRFLGDCCRIAARPANLKSIRRVLLWHGLDGGIPASANWYERMTYTTMARKLKAMEQYSRESRAVPHPRAPENLTAVARVCGSAASCEFAEPFTLHLQR